MDLWLTTLLVVTVIALWATALVPEYLTALLFFTTAMALKLAPAEIVFAGFRSAAFWLILSGFVLGAAIQRVGLADRAARWLALRCSQSWGRMVGGVVLATYLLAFVMPSNMGRIALLMPIVMALADRCGLGPGSRGRVGLALAVGFGTFQLSASILPANVPNLVMAGAAERELGVHFAYLAYLALHGPILGVMKGLVLVGAILWLFPARPIAVTDPGPPLPVSPSEWRLALLLALALGLWMTDTLHGIEPAWVGLAAACVCLLPRVGFLDGDAFAAGVNLRTCLYIAGILGLAALVAGSGLGARLGQGILAWLPLDPARPATNFAALIGLTSLLNFAVTANGVPAVFTPLASALATGSGLPVMTVLMIQVIGYATPILPYQSSPIVVAMGMGRVPARDGIRLCLVVAALTFALLVPLDYGWFRLLGWIGAPAGG